MQREPDETMTMARIETAGEGAVLIVISRNESGEYTETRYAMDQLMACAFRGLTRRELAHIEKPPMRTHEEMLAVLANI